MTAQTLFRNEEQKVASADASDWTSEWGTSGRSKMKNLHFKF
jgi:hypothetical protein